ncbi:uncharacterized protein P174DRAFT_424390 [Aspergillus novofumigatus IBT 16806]|uniref:Uncharacterized protein n=1 Tax=Aspergillus novofumigatus (strain IBT 16806) TaxID=1392255 RepID=A0A2I1BXY3_ASPN1|nr:uncharacterized protein P174DRAFT_424390 [Aspergillus novofumigatus IBT 16806]PKX90201.1 hypothetical protein P174DRAFT_424390 [Aspergillus novofumigatus IBT 16806]
MSVSRLLRSQGDLDQRYKTSTTASRKDIFHQQHFKIYATVPSKKKTLSSEAQIQSLYNMKITALLALALAAVVAASPVAEPELVERSCKSSCASVASSSCSQSCSASPSCYIACYNAKYAACLTSCDPYRSTDLPNFWLYPLTLAGSRELFKDDISAILRAHEFPERVPFLPYIAQKPHYPGGNTIHQGKLSPVHEDETMTKIRIWEKQQRRKGDDGELNASYYGDTADLDKLNLLRVMLLAADDHPSHLGPAKDDLAGLLHERGITDMFVEMVNVDLCFQPSLFPMSPDHGLVVGFEEGKQRIIDLIQGTLKNNWRILCPFNVGRVDTEMKASLARHCQFQTVEVDFLTGDLRFLNGTSSAHLRVGPIVTTSYALVKAFTYRDVFLDMADISLGERRKEFNVI